MDGITILIAGEKWKICFMEEDAFVRIHGEGYGAMTIIDKKELHFHDGEMYKVHVTHELVHAYVSSLCLTSATSLSHDQLEEIYADMFAKHGATIMKQTTMIWKHLRSLAKAGA